MEGAATSHQRRVVSALPAAAATAAHTRTKQDGWMDNVSEWSGAAPKSAKAGSAAVTAISMLAPSFAAHAPV